MDTKKEVSEKTEKKIGIVERMVEVALDNNLTRTALERGSGMTKGTIIQAMKEERPISTHSLELFIKYAPKFLNGRKLNYEWLLEGVGTKYSNAYRRLDPKNYVNEKTEQSDFNEHLLVALDNRDVQEKLMETIKEAQ